MNPTLLSRADLAQKIDHTLLKPTLLVSELRHHCEEAKNYGFKTVCVPPIWVPEAHSFLQGSSVETITVVGFPLGYSHTRAKIAETEKAIAEGASEIDMVIQISLIKNQRWKDVEADIAGVAIACGPVPLKVIIETAYLTQSEKLTAAQIAETAGAQFVKTSTGFASGVPHSGATLEDIQLLRQSLKPKTKIKASGGIRDYDTALQMIEAGADRLGTSAGVAILSGLKNESDY